MMMEDLVPAAVCQRVAKALAARQVRERTWACGKFEDDRLCLVADGQVWKVGYFERGNFDVRYETADVDDAISYFVDWVTEEERAKSRAAADYKAWRKRHGLPKP